MEDRIEAGSVWRHADGGVYKVAGPAKMKCRRTGEWFDAIMYRPLTEPYAPPYVRTVAEFLSRFTRAGP